MHATYCFIANYFLTPLQSALAKRLQQRGVRVCWVVVNTSLRQMLLDDGWAESSILHVHLGLAETPREFDAVALKFHDLLHADRALRHRPEQAMRYLSAAAHAIHAFFERQRPDFVFGENTWAHERIAAALCAASASGRQYLAPHTVRFPSGRWGFFRGEDQADLVGGSVALSAIPPDSALAAIDTAPPSYVQRNNELLADAKTLRARLNRIKRFITRENIDPTDPTNIQGRWATLEVMGREELNRILYRHVPRIPADATALGRKFVLYAMHKQPESSIDVIGRYYEDQFKVIHAIWRSLPAGWSIYVKEHTNAIGDRPPAFYDQINCLPGAYVVDEKASAKALIAVAQAVFTISGTIAYEAALMGQPSFTFAPLFFNELKHCTHITLDDLRDSRDLSDLIARTRARPDNDAAFDIVGKSFEGRFTDVHTDPTVLDADNLALLESAFLSLTRGR